MYRSKALREKTILLLGTVVCYNVLFYGIEMVIAQNFSVVLLLKQSLPINYYVWLYSTLYLISPYINLCLNQLDKRKLQLFCVILIGLLIYLMSSMVVYGLLHLSMAALEYCNLFVVLASFGLVMFFVKRQIKERIFVSRLASVSFNVFLVHGFLMPYLKYIPLDIFWGDGTLLEAMIVSVIVVLILYMASVVISISSKFVMNPIIGKNSNLLYW